MRRPAIYSRSLSGRLPDGPRAVDGDVPGRLAQPTAAAQHAAAPHPVLATHPATGPISASAPAVGTVSRSPSRLLWLAVALLSIGLGASLAVALRSAPRALTQGDIDAAVLRTLASQPLASPAARAAEAVRPSVVRVVGYNRAKAGRGAKKSDGEEEIEHGIGTGVVIVDKGVILTNLHVVQGADRIEITFADGMESAARITGTQPENDLAVLQASKVPDDLPAATLRSTAKLAPGDQVVAVGYPFGIGPSVSAGVVSGLEREFRSPQGKRTLSHLIQFDAAANPGNSGGPLVTMDGAVVGIVTAIFNPTAARTFLGIGFAVPIENAAQAVGAPPF